MAQKLKYMQLIPYRAVIKNLAERVGTDSGGIDCESGGGGGVSKEKRQDSCHWTTINFNKERKRI